MRNKHAMKMAFHRTAFGKRPLLHDEHSMNISAFP